MVRKSVSNWKSTCPANKEPFLNQLTCVKLVHNWYRSTNTCFHVYSREYTCSAYCHKFWTSLPRVVLGQNRYGFTGTCHHVKHSWLHGKHVSTHQICSQNPMNSRTAIRWIQVQKTPDFHEWKNSWFHVRKTRVDTPNLFTESREFTYLKHVNWASWTREFIYKTREITGRCLLGTLYKSNLPEEN